MKIKQLYEFALTALLVSLSVLSVYAGGDVYNEDGARLNPHASNRENDLVNVTFNVNMVNENVSSNGVFLKGNWDNWEGDYQMFRGNGAEVYTGTFEVPANQQIEYKFYNGNPASGWGFYIGEDFLGSCTDVWTNRIFQIQNDDVVLDTICFNSCSNCQAAGQVLITFNVDMLNTPIANEGVYLQGSFNNWGNPSVRLTESGGICSAVVKLMPGETIEYRFVNGSLPEQNISGGCTNGTGNRVLIVPGADEVLETVCFNLCTACDLGDPDKVQLTFHLDATHSQYQQVQMIQGSAYHNYYDTDNDRIFDLILQPDAGRFEYFVLRDNAWGSDPDNPLHPGDYPSTGSYMMVADPMISYLLPMDGDMMRTKQIRADFAFSANNPPEAGSIVVTINGNTVADAGQYFNSGKLLLLIDNPPFLAEGTNQVTVSYSTSLGTTTRTSNFTYQPVKLMIDQQEYRMDHILAWGRVFTLPLPEMVFLECNGNVYTAQVNSGGYFGADVAIQDGNNPVKVACTEAGLLNPVDVMNVSASVRHKWWIELVASVNGTTASLQAIPHGIAAGQLQFEWRNRPHTTDTIPGIGGQTPLLTFTLPSQAGNYEIELKTTDNEGLEYYARKMLATGGNPHFIGIEERAPWMEKMVLYEVEGDYFDWGQYSFQNIRNTFSHMVNLGVNSFRLTPFVTGGFISSDHFDIYPPYGSINDLKEMVETAHEFGLKVLFDIPLSHVSSYHPYIAPSFFLGQNSQPYANFIMWAGEPGESDVVFSPDNGRQCVYTNLSNPYTQEYFIRLMEYWVEVAGCDGFRIDCGQESLMRAPGFIKELHERLRNIKPELFILNEGDPRDYPDVNFYAFGDAAYSWKLNSEWGDGGQGLPGLFKGVYTVDQLHDLIVAGIPSDSGLIMNYANSGYHDYLHNRYGWEQERAALSLVCTTYGLVNIRAGEEVGAARTNGMFDFDDPLETMPLYSRLLKMRKQLLGNYPQIERITQNIPDQVYAYTSKTGNAIVLTLVNFAADAASLSLNLNDAILGGQGKTHWYNVNADEVTDNSQSDLFQTVLSAWEGVVYVLNAEGISTDVVPVTFWVDMKNETVSPYGIYLNGSFCGWNAGDAVQMTEQTFEGESYYGITIQLPVGEAVEYKFVNGSPLTGTAYEILSGMECAYGFGQNRKILVPEAATTLAVNCFGHCNPCQPNGTDGTAIRVIGVTPNPAQGTLVVTGLGNMGTEIRMFDMEGRLVLKKTIDQASTEILNIGSFRPGVYHLQIVENGIRVKSIKIIKIL